MNKRMALLQDAHDLIHTYTKTDTWRPGLVDVFAYTYIIDMYEDADENEIWLRTPDEIMEETIANGYMFDSGLEFGSEQLWEEVRDYLIEKGFVRDADEEEEEEE